MQTTYEMEIAGVKRNLPLFPVNENLTIAALIIFGDVELTVKSAGELLKKAPEFDIMLTAEAKSIPLIHEMARQAGVNKYIVARKGEKVYMKDPLSVEVNSITTKNTQKLFIDANDAALLRGHRVLIIDDVISTGESLNALEHLVNEAGGNIVGKMAILAEGEAADRDDLIFLEKLPLFHPDGTIME